MDTTKIDEIIELLEKIDKTVQFGNGLNLLCYILIIISIFISIFMV